MRAWAVPRPLLRLVTVLAVAASVVLVGPGVAGAGGDRGDGRPGGGGPARDAVTVSGYDDYQVDRTVDVVNRTDGNNLVFWFTAGRAMVDGALTIELPTRSWATPLRASGTAPFEGLGPLDPLASGVVGIRPAPSYPEGGNPARYCDLGASYTLPNGTAHAYVFEFDVTNNDRVRRIEATHLTCAAGQKIAIRIVGLTAPRTGLERFTVRVSDVAGPRWVADPALAVKPTPAVRLVIDDLGPTVSADPNKYTKAPGRPNDFGVPVRVRAVGPTGRPVPYSGTIRMYTSPLDCAVLNKGFKDFPTTRFTGPTRFLFPFTQGGTYALVAEDIDHKAVAATSNVVTVVDGTRTPQCPASYH